MSRARTQRLETEASPGFVKSDQCSAWPGTTKNRLGNFFVECPWQESKQAMRGSHYLLEPVGFRVKSNLRNHCAIVQPRLYDSAQWLRRSLFHDGKWPRRTT
jgi:hypothetical protein